MYRIGILILLLTFLSNCTPTKKSETSQSISSKIEVPDWAKNANIYEVNIRQYTKEGTFEAFQTHLPRLKEMGVDILWFMPIHPISSEKRKGTLGSYYAVSDFRAVNPQFGTKESFKATVDKAHALGMKVLIDWVPHHTGWDHVWIESNPEYFSKDDNGNIIDPINEETGEPWGWTDVAELKLDNPEMRKSIIEDMKYWIEEFNIDGYRVDHAHGVPDDYWDQVSQSLAQLNRPIFMLAEGEEPWLRNDKNFVMTYAWHFHHVMNAIAKGEENVNKIDTVLSMDRARYKYGYHTYFTSNHDENSWAGTVEERMGDGHKAMAVLAATIDGMPLLYSGQEAPLQKRLEFFEKDPIDWNGFQYQEFYTTLLHLKKRNKAIWNGELGAFAKRINKSNNVYAFERKKYEDELIVIINLSDTKHSTELFSDINNLTEVFSGEKADIPAGSTIELGPWDYLVYSNK